MLVVKLPDGGEVMQVASNDVIEAKLRRFYTFWALKEAYVKMTGDALLADWLRVLEFRKVRAPRPASTNAQEIRKSKSMGRNHPRHPSLPQRPTSHGRCTGSAGVRGELYRRDGCFQASAT